MADQKVKRVRLLITWTPDELADIDDWRRQQPDIPPRTEAIRELTRRGLRTGADPQS